MPLDVTAVKHSFYITQETGYATSWPFTLKAQVCVGCKYLNSGQLDVVGYKPGQTVTHEEDHHVPPTTHTHKQLA